MEIKKCVVCGNEFIQKRINHLCCSGKCSYKRWSKKSGIVKEANTNQIKTDTEKRHNAIAQIAIEARKQGMSYGNMLH